jgi:hypothetical protein
MPEPPAPPPAPDLAAIAARAAAATPEPWHVEPGSRFVYPEGTPESEQFFLLVDQYGDWLDFDGYWRGRADVDFIAHARTDMPALVAYARVLDAENARLRRELARVLDDYAEECESESNMTRPEFDAYIDALLTTP